MFSPVFFIWGLIANETAGAQTDTPNSRLCDYETACSIYPPVSFPTIGMLLTKAMALMSTFSVRPPCVALSDW